MFFKSNEKIKVTGYSNDRDTYDTNSTTNRTLFILIQRN